MVRLIGYSNTRRSRKKYYTYAIASISLLIIYQYHKYLFVINRKLDLIPITAMDTESYSSTPTIYSDRSRALRNRCNHLHSAASDIRYQSALDVVRENLAFRWATFLLQSKSLMYCAVPKIATKTILTVMNYIHLRDILDHLNNNWTNVDVHRARAEQSINISAFTEELRKVQRTNRNTIFENISESFILEWNYNPKNKRIDFSSLISSHLS
jgi:hypothetical protein